MEKTNKKKCLFYNRTNCFNKYLYNLKKKKKRKITDVGKN